ncbi:MAG: glycine betaine ABC transporter substrate-binding protein [Caldilineaceae bacterium]
MELGRSGQLQSPQLIVGSKSSTEQMLLGQMMIVMLEDIGYRVEDKTGLGYSQLVRDALRNGEIDMYMELTGTALASYQNLPLSALPGDPEQAFNLARRMDEAKGLVWLPPARSNDTDTLIVRQELADQNIHTIEDVANYIDANEPALTLCVEQEFAERQIKGLDDLLETYGLHFAPDNILISDLNETYAALRNGQCDVAQGIATDGRISAWGLVSLVDTLQFFPAYTPAPIVRSDVLEANPGLAAYLGQLGEFLDNDAMRQLNAQIELGDDGVQASGDEHNIREVATTFLCNRRIITNCAASASDATSIVTVTAEPVAAQPAAAPASVDTSAGDASNDSASSSNDANRDASSNDASASNAAEGDATNDEQPNSDETTASTDAVSETLPVESIVVIEPTPTPAPTMVITIPSAYGVNARQRPSTNSPVVQVLTRGSSVTATGRLANSTWVQVSLAENIQAWVFADAVLYPPNELETLPVVAP